MKYRNIYTKGNVIIKETLICKKCGFDDFTFFQHDIIPDSSVLTSSNMDTVMNNEINTYCFRCNRCRVIENYGKMLEAIE